MIILRGGTNEVSFTLNEKFDFYTPSVSTYHELYYVVKIDDNMSDYTQNFILLSANDLSLNKDRSNKFRIDVTGTYNDFLQNTTDPYSALQSYPIIGMTGSNEFNFDSQWNYSIYAMDGPAPVINQGDPVDTWPPILIETGPPRFLYRYLNDNFYEDRQPPRLLEQGRMIYTNKYGKPQHLPN